MNLTDEKGNKFSLQKENAVPTLYADEQKKSNSRTINGTASDNSVPQNPENVNIFDKKFSDRDTYEDYDKPITAADIQKTAKWAYKFYRELGTKSPLFRAWFGDWRAYDTSDLLLPEKMLIHNMAQANQQTL